jgi:hypothetical protein
LLAEYSPADALRSWMDRFETRFENKRAMGPALRSLTGSGTFSIVETRAILASAVRTILDAGIASGDFRDDVSADDLVAALAGICMACSGAESAPQLARLMDLLIAGVIKG